jgi:hypothetical protein
VGALIRVGAVLAAVAVAAAGVLLLGHDTSSPRSDSAAAPSVRTSFVPPAVQFGDPLTVQIAVRLDDRSVLPDSFHVTSGVAPLTQLGPTRTTRTSRGHVTVVSIAIPTVCVVDACIAKPGETRVHLPVVVAHVTGIDGRVRQVSATWPPLPVGSRVTTVDLRHETPPLRADTAPASPSYRISPRLLARLLDALAVLLAASGVVLAYRQAAGIVRRRRHPEELDPLELALRRVREAQARSAPDRRRALGNLARVLDRRGSNDAEPARDLAWSRPVPTPERATELAGRIEEGGSA